MQFAERKLNLVQLLVMHIMLQKRKGNLIFIVSGQLLMEKRNEFNYALNVYDQERFRRHRGEAVDKYENDETQNPNDEKMTKSETSI